MPLFVAGGHNSSIYGYNAINSRQVFLLNGHTDFIRTVEFHHNMPWVLSASDDQTTRIWNWQNR
jgi:coatomer subunit alpha